MKNGRVNTFILRIATAFAVVFSFHFAQAAPLSKEALYYRCYQQLTGERPSDSDPNLVTFRAGSGDPIGTCITMLRSAQFADGVQIPATASRQVMKILTQLHRVHSSFFLNTVFDLPKRNFRDNTATGDMIDMTTPALYFTRALFNPNLNVSSVVTGTEYLVPKRTILNPFSGPISNVGGKQTKDASGAITYTDDISKMYPFGLSSGFFTPIGALLGVTVKTPRTYSYSWNRLGSSGQIIETVKESFAIGDGVGAGFLGSEAYLLLNVRQNSDFKADLKVMPRKWASAVYNDALCRSFPVARSEDVTSFVVPTSGLPFRQQQSCTQCHASMDRVASLIRGFHYYRPGGGDLRPVQFKFETPSLAAPSPAWPSELDTNYSKTPAQGTLFYRSATNGALVNVDVSSLEQMGQTLAAQDDFYLCVANRYWNYFTNKGLKLNDAQMMASYPLPEQARLTTVKKLASDLKTNQKLISLIEAILRSPAYQDSAFGQ